jgi:Tfp pilus assembly protein PilF
MFNLAVAYLHRGKVTSAKRWFLKAIEIEPKLELAYRGGCIACFKLGQYQEAL